MLPVWIRERLGPHDADRALRALGEPGSERGRELRAVLRRGSEQGATAEQIALAVGLVLTLAEPRATLTPE